MSVLSISNKNAYYTSNCEVKRLLQVADRLWGLEGKVVLEPSVGSGAFPLTANRLGYDTKWVTNELFPEQTNYQADTNQDFLVMEAGRVDAVLGNPPYTGTTQGTNGQRQPLWLAFIHRSFEWADQVAFVLPLASLDYSFLSRLPEGVEVVAWTEPHEAPYVLGGVGQSDIKSVKTTTVFLERTGFAGYQFHREPPEGFEWVTTQEDQEATHAVSMYGNAGEVRCLRGSWGRRVPFCANEERVVVKDPRIEALLASGVIREFAKQRCSAIPALSRAKFNHLLTVAAKRLDAP
jgi:hypothetical protein